MQKYLLIIFSFIILNIYSQEFNSIALPNTFQHKDNDMYWKNKKPYTDYWQQDVSYKIDAEIDEKTDIIHGKQKLQYWNNSPDTLYHVFFHLYSNQAVKDSYLDKLTRAKGGVTRFGKYQEQGLGIEILSMQANGVELKKEEDNTIMKVYLEKPLLPNENITFDIIFKNYYDNGSIRRRMKMYKAWGKKHYNGAHWYPRIAVYDKKFGWSTNQHLGREFYGDFGTFDVKLTFANDYIVGATGFLQNREEMYPKELWKKLKLKNFKKKTWKSAPSTIIERKEGEKKTWHFYAENLHDFAFVADPHFRIGEAEWNGIKTYSFVQEPHAAKWQNAAEYTAKIIKVFSEDFGMYEWHKMLVVDARSGMEYPMLTMDNGSDPGYRDLLVHEVAHNWFYGMVNNNETYRALLDEGFAQFLTAWGLEKIDGKYEVEKPQKNWYTKKFRKPIEARERRVYISNTRASALDQSHQLNTHSDCFTNRLDQDHQYWQVYSKTAAMLYNLQYTLGDKLFLEAMKYYVQKWKFCHPYPEDFRQSIIEYSHSDLNWFFDQWLETSKTLDYKIINIENNDTAENAYNITFKRIGKMQMPIDFQVTDKTGEKYDFHIPNNWFTKKTSAKVLPKWIGWNKLNEEYTATIQLPKTENKKTGVIENVVIDPTERLADDNMTNNRLKGNTNWQFDSHVWNITNRKQYQMYWRPDLWWNAYDGLKTGINIKGNYLGQINNFNLLFGFNTRLLQANIPFENAKHYTNDRFYYRFSYSTPTNKIIPFSRVNIQSRFLDGLVLNKIKFTKDLKNNVAISLAFKSMIRPEQNDNKYLLFPKEWETEKWNNKISLSLVHKFRFNKNKTSGKVKANVSTSVFSDYNDFAVKLEYTGKEKLWKLDLKSRIFAKYNLGNTAYESMLYLAGANPEEMMENKYTRATGFFPTNWVSDYSNSENHFHYGGGLNLRAYAGRNNLVQTDSLAVSYAYKGNSGMAVNFEIGFDRLISFKKIPKFFKNFDFDMYLFGDLGIMTFTNTLNTKSLLLPRGDAGIGTTLTIKKFGPLYNIKPIVIRFDMPFYVSHPISGENNFSFRWLVGINRAF